MASKQEAQKELGQKFENPKGHPRDRIIIHDNPEIPREGIFLSLNGFAFLCKAGVEIDIPRPIRHMLDTRIKTETFQDENGKNYTRDIPRITYMLIKEDVDKDVVAPASVPADPFGDD